jgi:N-acyl-D-amino-acid deacylase
MMKEMSRREFIKTGSLISAGIMIGCKMNPRFDILIQNAQIADGTGKGLYLADLAVSGDKIAAIGQLSGASAGLKIDASGKIVAPGFIDIHTHTDIELLVDSAANSKLMQGVTTEIGGNCGGSVFPLDEKAAIQQKESMAERFGRDLEWRTMPEFYDLLEKQKITHNYGSFMGNGTLRAMVMGREERRANSSQLEKMKNILRENFEAGLLGLSSGLEYAPSGYADTAELIELCKVAAQYGKIYNTHMRNEDDRLLEAIDEAIEIAQKAGCSLEIAHLKAANPANWHKIDAALERMERARQSGLNINADRYPYIAYSTGLQAFLPLTSRQGSNEEIKARLREPSQRAFIEEYVHSRGRRIGGWQNVLISGVKNKENQRFQGKSVLETAEIRGESPFDCIIQLLLEEDLQVSIVGFAMDEGNLKKILSHDLLMIGSDGNAISPDGPFGGRKPHPRGYGSFARVLGKYCRDEKLFPWETAIKKMTSMPAEKLGLKNRGRLEKGYFADIVIFDSETVMDKATFIEPHQFAAGIEHVFVNGSHAVKDGQFCQLFSGCILRGA